MVASQLLLPRNLFLSSLFVAATALNLPSSTRTIPVHQSPFFSWDRCRRAVPATFSMSTKADQDQHITDGTLVDDPSDETSRLLPSTEKAMFGMGCFWMPQQEFTKLYGVENAVAGYARAEFPTRYDGLTTSDDAAAPKQEMDEEEAAASMRQYPASYLSVCNGDGRTEAILVEYDPTLITYKQLLQTFWKNHDASVEYPRGKEDHYRSVLWPLTENQREVAIEDVQRAREAYREEGMDEPRTIVADLPKTLVLGGGSSSGVDGWLDREFTKAEGIHQNFWSKLRLKVAFLASITLFATYDVPPYVKDGINVVGKPLFLLWVGWEIAELAASAAGSMGLSFPTSPERRKV